MRRSIFWPTIISASALLMVVLTLAETRFSAPVGFWFLLICPGMAYVRLLHIEEPMTEVLLAIAFSIAITTIVSETMLLAGVWSPTGGLLTLVFITLSGVVFQVVDALGTRSDMARRESR